LLEFAVGLGEVGAGFVKVVADEVEVLALDVGEIVDLLIYFVDVGHRAVYLLQRLSSLVGQPVLHLVVEPVVLLLLLPRFPLDLLALFPPLLHGPRHPFSFLFELSFNHHDLLGHLRIEIGIFMPGDSLLDLLSK
jgi:hypothetical protein